MEEIPPFHHIYTTYCIIDIVVIAIRVKNSECLHRTFNVDPLYLQHENSGVYNINNLHFLN